MVSSSDEVLILENNKLVPTQVMNTSSLIMKGYLYFWLIVFYSFIPLLLPYIVLCIIIQIVSSIMNHHMYCDKLFMII